MLFNWEKFLESVGEKDIENIVKYINDMNQTISDKLFFIDKIDFDTIVDFGCADGELLSKISKVKPTVNLIGYDLDKKMLKIADNKLQGKAVLTDNWSNVIKNLKGKTLLNLSSVIHEVYSYSHPKTVKYFWENQVFNMFDYISIRDMIPSTKMSSIELKDFKNDVNMVKEKINDYRIKSFEKIWGDLTVDYRTFIHFLLKYRYTDNWEREVRENYLPVSIETLIKKIPTNYKIIYKDHFILDYLKSIIKEDFNIDVKHNTHLKMIIKKL